MRFCSIITEAELKPDKIYEGEPLCDRCMECYKICPTRAIKKETRKCVVADREIEYAKYDKVACFYSILGLAPGTGGIANIKPPNKEKFSTRDITRARAKAILKHREQYIYQVFAQFVEDWADFCGRCLHICDKGVQRSRRRI